MKIIVIMSMVTTLVLASAYRVPEQSFNAAALSNAYLANSNGADTAYFNPANMVYNTDEQELEFALNYINIPANAFSSAATPVLDAVSKEGHLFVPTFHYVSQKYGDYRFGLSLTGAYGLAVNWDDPLPNASAKKFDLKVMELNPSVAYMINDKLSIAAGLRVAYALGKVITDSSNLNAINPAVASAGMDIKGNDLKLGYNLAIAYRPNNKIFLSATYKSKIDLKLEGDAKLTASGTEVYNDFVSVKVPVPAVLAIGAAYNISESTTVEFVYERVYWSILSNLDFNFKANMGAFDTPIEKNWKDTNNYSIGLTHTLTSKSKILIGYTKDTSPIPQETLGFEVPTANMDIYAMGYEHYIDDTQSVGIAYNNKRSEKGVSTNPNALGTFDAYSVQMLTLSYKLKF